jgi:hypothetical protein
MPSSSLARREGLGENRPAQEDFDETGWQTEARSNLDL